MVQEKYLLLILFTHWIGDFILKNEYMATKKSTSNKALGLHVLVYSIVWMIALYIQFLFKTEMVLLFILITAFCHFTQDYITSRINKFFLSKNDTHNFFVCIGFDQILHYLQLYYTLKWLGLML